MSDHARASELAAISLDFALSEPERSELDAHLASCASCSAHLAGLQADARAIAALPRVDAPDWVHRRVIAEPEMGWPMRLRLAAVAVSVVVVAVGVFAATDGLRFGGSAGAEREPGASVPAVTAAAGSTGPSEHPATAAPPTASETPSMPSGAWEAIRGQEAFDASVVAPPRDTSRTPPPCGSNCGDTGVGYVPVLSAVTAAIVDGDSITAVGYGCISRRVLSTCQADVWASEDGRTWRAAEEQSFAAGSDNSRFRPTGMFDVVAGGPGLVAAGSRSRNGRPRATVWTTAGDTWRRTLLERTGDSEALAVTDGWGVQVAVGRARTDGKTIAAVWVSSGDKAWTHADVVDPVVAMRDPSRELFEAGMLDVIAIETGFLAVGSECDADYNCRVASWSAGPDGRRWTRTTDGRTEGRVRAVVRFGDLLVGVGDDGRRDGLGRIWTSEDGSRWDQAPDIESETPRLRAVVTYQGGLVAAGDFIALWSGDGRTWHRLDDGDLANARVFGLASAHGAIVAVGSDVGGDPERPSIWLLPR